MSREEYLYFLGSEHLINLNQLIDLDILRAEFGDKIARFGRWKLRTCSCLHLVFASFVKSQTRQCLLTCHNTSLVLTVSYISCGSFFLYPISGFAGASLKRKVLDRAFCLF